MLAFHHISSSPHVAEKHFQSKKTVPFQNAKGLRFVNKHSESEVAQSCPTLCDPMD